MFKLTKKSIKQIFKKRERERKKITLYYGGGSFSFICLKFAFFN